MGVVLQYSSIVLCIHIESLSVERRILISKIVDGVGRVIWIKLYTATPLLLEAGTLSVAEVADFIHVDPKSVHRQKIVVEVGNLKGFCNDYIMV